MGMHASSYTDVLVTKLVDWTTLKTEDTYTTRAGKVVFGSLCSAALEIVALVEHAATFALALLLKPIDFLIPKQYTWFSENIFQPVSNNLYASCNTTCFLFKKCCSYFRNLHINGYPENPYHRPEFTTKTASEKPIPQKEGNVQTKKS